MSVITVWHWFSLAVLLGILELILGGNFILLACSAAAFLTGIIVAIFPFLNISWQGLLFCFNIILSLVVWRRYLKKKQLFSKPSDMPYLNQRARQYINRSFTLEEPIINRRGRVKVDDTIWRVEGEDLPAGTRIQVVDVDGIILIIKKIEYKE